ncbi:hypothetical protein DFJ73DRAFT_632530 [Zopfochytrium polystomum]|nr:hypothetical protein DFJ73DRAFT_632530 [Zopfochytrium polystomum]
MSDDAYESVLLVVKECMVYRIPPRANSRGYRASDWDVNQFLWKGRLRVVAKGDDLFIKLEDSTTGELFAQCPYNMDGTSVEPVLDSSRYFVLTIVDIASGKHAFIGMGFPERSWAFDFNVAIQDHVKSVDCSSMLFADLRPVRPSESSKTRMPRNSQEPLKVLRHRTSASRRTKRL